MFFWVTKTFHKSLWNFLHYLTLTYPTRPHLVVEHVGPGTFYQRTGFIMISFSGPCYKSGIDRDFSPTPLDLWTNTNLNLDLLTWSAIAKKWKHWHQENFRIKHTVSVWASVLYYTCVFMCMVYLCVCMSVCVCMCLYSHFVARTIFLRALVSFGSLCCLAKCSPTALLGNSVSQV